MEHEFKFLRPTGLHAHAWISQDIHPAGAAGDASLGTAEKGKQWLEVQAERFIEVLRDVEKFELTRLAESRAANSSFPRPFSGMSEGKLNPAPDNPAASGPPACPHTTPRDRSA